MWVIMRPNTCNTKVNVASLASLEMEGGITNADGIDVEDAFRYRSANRSLRGFPGATFHENGLELLELPCDILIPAALLKTRSPKRTQPGSRQR
jgi:glutamate dehydrogenase/leucine dehydrogenase